MTTDDERYAIATANRLLAADMFAGLSEEQWTTPSLCEGWTVREVCAHLVPPAGGFTVLGTIGTMLRYRFDLDRMVDETTRKEARQPTDVLVALLRERAHVPLKAPVVGAAGPMSDTAIHLRDAARPLGFDVDPGVDAWRPVLDFLVTRNARGFVPKGLLADLALATTDSDWRWGAGAGVRGTSEAVALAVSGRSVVLDELDGPGVTLLRQRLGP